MLYQTAIQTGLRAGELRSLTRGRLYLDAKPPRITCKAGSTKNRKDARQYIQSELAADLKVHITTKAPKAPVFGLPHESNLAKMLRDDLAEARKGWLQEAKDDPKEYAQREQSDFLADVNHEGELTDFHCLRHTCGAWLAMTGAHPKVVQTVMRHQSITLTMDTYGHLFPGQEADAVGRMHELMFDSSQTLKATGTDNTTANSLDSRAAHAQQSGRQSMQKRAATCNEKTEPGPQRESSKSLQIAHLGDSMWGNTKGSESSGEGTRTPDTRIMIPLL